MFIIRKIIRNNILSNNSRYICKKTNTFGKYAGNIVGNKNDEDKKRHN